MNPNDINLAVIELAAKELEPLLDQLTLVGGCAVGLLITDPTRPAVRATIDVDLLTEVTSLVDYYALSNELTNLGFVLSGDIVCRFRKGGLIVDVMPTHNDVLGFGNAWYPAAFEQALQLNLPSGRKIRHVSGPFCLATKLEAFHGRGNGDYMHHDIEDLVNLIDGRPELTEEVRSGNADLRDYLEEQFEGLLGDNRFIEAIPQHFHPSEDHGRRLPMVIERMRRIAGL
ncbi:hypothetical protein [Dyella silvae]|uniref:hypothetical protein n=1 Tax=Dyella silvae TaxID=2994424 RepID=UPI002264A362|nr:hypothetical protein [Dyella silvae]